MARRRGRSRVALARYVTRRARNRGLFGESPVWRWAFYALTARKLARKLAGKEPEIVLSERLRPGQPIGLVAIDAASQRRERKQLAAAERLAEHQRRRDEITARQLRRDARRAATATRRAEAALERQR